jgi:hypothetical protein
MVHVSFEKLRSALLKNAIQLRAKKGIIANQWVDIDVF